MEKKRHKDSRILKRILAYMLTFVMVVGLMPVTAVKAEEGSVEAGLYFAEWDWNDKSMNRLCDRLYCNLPDDTGVVLVSVTNEGESTTYQSVDMSQIEVTYSTGYDEEKPSSLPFSELAEGQMTKCQLSEEGYHSWAIKEIGGGNYIQNSNIPVSWYNLNKTGTYKFTYTVDEKEQSCYLIMNHRAWDFYETDEITDTPLREYFYQDIAADTGFYLKQSDENASLGKLTYNEDGRVNTDNNGNPVLEQCSPLIAARFQWNDEAQQDEVVENYSDCISYDSDSGKISIRNNPSGNVSDYVVRVYFYVTETYEENGERVTNYRQDSTDVWVNHGEDMRDSVWLGYDDWNGTVSWNLQGSEESTPLNPYQDIVGQADGVYDIYLTEKPEYPDNFDQWGTDAENRYGWRAGAEPVVFVRNGDDTVEYRVDATEEANKIDDCADEDNTTWHFTYTYKAGDNIEVFWSDYDAFSYNDTEQFQIEMGVQNDENGGSISLSPTPTEGDSFKHETYGEKYNFAVSMLKNRVTLTFTPSGGNTLEEFRIGDTRYTNQIMVEESFEGETFTPKEDGSYTYTLKEGDVKAYRWEPDNTKVADTDENGNQRYGCVHIEARFRGSESGPGAGDHDVTYDADTTISSDLTMNDVTVNAGILTIDGCSLRIDHQLAVKDSASIVGTSASSKLVFAGGAFSNGIALYYQDQKISGDNNNDFSNHGDGPVEFNWDMTSSRWVTNQQPAEGGGGGDAPWYTVSYGNSANLTTKNGKVYAERVHIGDITYSSIASEYNASEEDKIYSMEDTIFRQKTEEEENNPESGYEDPLMKYGIGGSDGDIFIRPDVSGVSIDFKFIPDFGYQLTNIYTNENETDSLLNDFTAAEAVSSFEFKVKQGGNVHFEVKFEKVDNKVTGNADVASSAKIESTNYEAASGTLEMKVDNVDASSNISSGSEALAAYDITLKNVVSKGGDRGSWDTPLTDLGENAYATVTLPFENADTTHYNYTVIREHNGQEDILPPTVENGAISFSTGKFSKYTIVKTPIQKSSIENAEITLGTSLTYNGAAQTQTVSSVKIGDTVLTPSTDYKVSGNEKKDAGTYTLTITGTGNYTGTATKEFTISKAAPNITLSNLSETTQAPSGVKATISPEDATAAVVIEYQVEVSEKGQTTKQWVKARPAIAGTYPVRAYLPEGTTNLEAVTDANAVAGTYILTQYTTPTAPSEGSTGGPTGGSTGGSTGSTTTEIKPDGTKVETSTETKADGTKVETAVEMKTDGTRTEMVVETAKDGSVKTTETVTNADGSSTKTQKETETNTKGKAVAVTITTVKDAKGKVTGITETSVIEKVAGSASATVNVEKNPEGKIISAQAKVAKKGAGTKSGVKATLSGSVIAQITEAAETKSVNVEMAVAAGEKEYTVKADTKDITAGKKLKVMSIDEKTGEYVLVNAKTYTVSDAGNVKVTLQEGAVYQLMDTKKAAKIEKAVLSTVKVKKTSATVEKGKKIAVQMSSKLDMDNVKKITYSTSKKNVATVSASGKVTAKNAGTAVIKAKVTLMNEKTKTVTMKVKVTQ